MVGLPFETEEDRAGIARLAGAIRDRFRSAGSKDARVTLSLHPFVPKPGTPFQWSRMMAPGEMRAAFASLGSRLRGFTVKSPDLGQAYTEALLALGGEETGAVLVRLAEGERWDRAAAGAGIDAHSRLFADRDPEAPLPWNSAEVGRAGARNRREWDAAVRGGGEPA
jgi:hypothetical protein